MSGEGNESKKWLEQIFVAILTAILSTFGFYFTAKIEASNDKNQRRYENMCVAYQSFIASINRSSSPVITEILHIGELSDKVNTDSDIQNLEDSLEKLNKLDESYKFAWYLDNDFDMLRLYGSDIVIRYCDDIVRVLTLNDSSVNWNNYPIELQKKRNELIKDNNQVAYGWEPKIDDDERIKFILLNYMYKNLLSQMKKEIQNSN